MGLGGAAALSPPHSLPLNATCSWRSFCIWFPCFWLRKRKLMRTEEADPWWREDGDVQLWVGKKRAGGSGLAHPEHSHDGETEILILLLGFLTFPVKFLTFTAKGLLYGTTLGKFLRNFSFSSNTYILVLAMMLLWPQWSEDIRKMRFPVGPSWDKYEWRCFSFLLGNYLEEEHLYLKWCSGFSGRLYKLFLKIHII